MNRNRPYIYRDGYDRMVEIYRKENGEIKSVVYVLREFLGKQVNYRKRDITKIFFGHFKKLRSNINFELKIPNKNFNQEN